RSTERRASSRTKARLPLCADSNKIPHRAEVNHLLTQFAPQRMTRLFNHLVRAGKQCRRDADIQGTSRFCIDRQLEFCWPLDGEVGRFRTFDDLVYIGCASLEEIDEVGAVAHQCSHLDSIAITKNRG